MGTGIQSFTPVKEHQAVLTAAPFLQPAQYIVFMSIKILNICITFSNHNSSLHCLYISGVDSTAC